MERLLVEFYGPHGSVLKDLIHRAVVGDWVCHVQLRLMGGRGVSVYTQTYSSGGWYHPEVLDRLGLTKELLCSIEVPITEYSYDWTITPIRNTSSTIRNILWYYTGRPSRTLNCVTQTLMLLRKACPPLFTHHHGRDIRSPSSLLDFLRERLPTSSLRLGPKGSRILVEHCGELPNRHPWTVDRGPVLQVGSGIAGT